MSESQKLSGPEFIRAVANAETCNGMTINAAESSRRSEEWQRALDNLAMVKVLSDANADALAGAQARAARAYDVLSEVRPAGECAREYQQVRKLLALIGNVEHGPAAWEEAATTERDPRVLPMPGDRFYLPVEVAQVTLKREGIDVHYAMLYANGESVMGRQRGKLPMLTSSSWHAGAIAIVAAPPAAPVLEMAA